MVSWKFLVDWDNDGDFDDANENISADIMRASWRLGMNNTFQEIADETDGEFVLSNLDGKYNPENSSSVLYGNLVPLRKMRVVCVKSDATEVIMWTGFLDTFSHLWQRGPVDVSTPEVTMRGVSAKQFMQSVEYALPIYTNTTADVIVADVLAVGVISGDWRLDVASKSELGVSTVLGDSGDLSNVETGILQIPTYGDMQPNNAWNILQDVTFGERGRFFWNRSGVGTWWNREHLQNVLSVTANINTQSGNYKPTDLNYGYGRLLATSVRVQTQPRKTSSSETLWELDSNLTLQPFSTEEIDVQLRKSTGQFAGASALTATPTFADGKSATVNVIPRGGKATISIVNATADTITMTGLTLEGAPTVNQNQMQVLAEDADAVVNYGRREVQIQTGSIIGYDDAKDIAQAELNRRKDLRGDVAEVAYTHAVYDSDLENWIDWTMGTRVNIQADEFEHNQDYWVMGEQWDWDLNETMVRYLTEPAIPAGLFKLGVGKLSETAYLGF